MVREILKYYRRFIISFLIMIMVVIAGTVGYWLLGRGSASLFDCFYMTIITMTTIGFGEILPVNQTTAGRLFTLIIAVSGVGAFTFILTNFTAMVASGELYKSLRQFLTLFRVRAMKNHYIICGSGEVGFQIAEELYLTKRQFIIIDKNDVELSRYTEQNIQFLSGDATDEKVLEHAGINEAAGLFAVTGDDNYNLVITFTARQMNQGIRIIAKLKDVRHSDKFRKAGADSVISPYHIGGLRMVSEMIRPTVVSFLDSMLRERQKNYRIEEITIADRHAGGTISQLQLGQVEDALLLSVRSGDEWNYNPAGECILREADALVFLITPEARIELEERLK